MGREIGIFKAEIALKLGAGTSAIAMAIFAPSMISTAAETNVAKASNISYPKLLKVFPDLRRQICRLVHSPSSISLAISSGPGNCPLSSLGRRFTMTVGRHTDRLGRRAQVYR